MVSGVSGWLLECKCAGCLSCLMSNAVSLSDHLQGALSEGQQQQVQRRVIQWKESAQRSLEAACGHSVGSASLLPYLKFAPTVRPQTPMCHTVDVHAKADCDNAKLRDYGIKYSGGQFAEHTEPGQASGQVSLSATAGEVDVVPTVRVFLVAQEPVGHLSPCVHVRMEAGEVYQPTPAEGLQSVFDMPILHSWASRQLKMVDSLRHMFCAMDPEVTDTCSLKDAKYVFKVVFGRSLSMEQHETIFKAFRGTPLRDAASKVTGTHERFRYVSMNYTAGV